MHKKILIGCFLLIPFGTNCASSSSLSNDKLGETICALYNPSIDRDELTNRGGGYLKLKTFGKDKKKVTLTLWIEDAKKEKIMARFNGNRLRTEKNQIKEPLSVLVNGGNIVNKEELESYRKRWNKYIHKQKKKGAPEPHVLRPRQEPKYSSSQRYCFLNAEGFQNPFGEITGKHVQDLENLDRAKQYLGETRYPKPVVVVDLAAWLMYCYGKDWQMKLPYKEEAKFQIQQVPSPFSSYSHHLSDHFMINVYGIKYQLSQKSIDVNDEDNQDSRCDCLLQ